MKQAKVDFLIVGGGIAGLWLLAELKAKGYSVLLCESSGLGGGQTIASQGIIHGGTKYALTGSVSKATTSIVNMPKRWKAALAGEDSVNLQGVKCLSQHQLLWTSPNIASKITGFFASKVMKSRMKKLATNKYPALFQHSDFNGNLYQLDEPVLDIPSLLQHFQEQFSDSIIHNNPETSGLIQRDNSWSFEMALPNNKQLHIQAKHIILSAGEGNESLCRPLKNKAPKMQRRPLQMVMLKSTDLPLIYAHALGVGDKPKVTITSHLSETGETVWYIGGEPAEKGVDQSAAALIQSTKKELQQLLPWVSFKNTEWSTFAINRAEGEQKEGKRPDQPVIDLVDNIAIAWPTKLAFAPMLADQVCHHFSALEPREDHYIPQDLPLTKVSKTVWDKSHFQ